MKEQTLLVLRLLARDGVPGRALVWLIPYHREKLAQPHQSCVRGIAEVLRR